MLEPVVGLVPLDDLIAGLRADVLADHEPAGETLDRLLRTVERHAELEADALVQYEHLGNASDDAVIALVTRLILDDEVRHHGLLKRLATTLRDALYWTQSPEALPKTGSVEGEASSEALVALAQALIKEEQAGAHMLRELAHRGKGLDSGLDSLLLELMAMDSDKHAHLLRFVERRLQARVRAAKTRPKRPTA